MAEVSLVAMNGQIHTGFLARFSPMVADITLSLSKDTKEKGRFAAEQIAYVGFHRAVGEPPARPQSRKAALKIHISGGRTFLVDLVEPEEPGSVGFYARPAEPQSPFREIFFTITASTCARSTSRSARCSCATAASVRRRSRAASPNRRSRSASP